MIQNLPVICDIIIGQSVFFCPQQCRIVILHGTDRHTGSFSCQNPHRNIFKHQTMLWGNREFFCCFQIYIRFRFPLLTSQLVVMASMQPVRLRASRKSSSRSLELLVAMPIFICCFFSNCKNSSSPGFSVVSCIYLSKAIRFHSSFTSSTFLES